MEEYPEARHQQLVTEYFAHIRDLRTGKKGAVENLLELWDADGTFEFSGAQPVTGTFRGKNAIHALYKNRSNANGMALGKLEGAGTFSEREAALGVVDTEVRHTRLLDEKVVAGWITTVGTSDGRGFQVAGSHTFTFKDGKISSLRVVVSPKPQAAENLRFEGLTVDDIGRLALAAWPVV